MLTPLQTSRSAPIHSDEVHGRKIKALSDERQLVKGSARSTVVVCSRSILVALELAC
jgi:hypothetical protein